MVLTSSPSCRAASALLWLVFSSVLRISSRSASAAVIPRGSTIFVDDSVLKSSKLSAAAADKVNNEELRRWLENLNDEDLGRYKM